MASRRDHFGIDIVMWTATLADTGRGARCLVKEWIRGNVFFTRLSSLRFMIAGQGPDLLHVDRKLDATWCHHMGWWPPAQYTCPPVSACCHIRPPPTWAFFLCVSACLTILSSLMKPFPQTSQVKGFSPVCRHMWRLKSVLWLNCLGQTSHL